MCCKDSQKRLFETLAHTNIHFMSIFLLFHIGSNTIWIIGDDILESKKNKKFVRNNLDLPTDKNKIYWFCSRGATLQNFVNNFHGWLQSNPSPTFLIIHLGLNDILKFNKAEIVRNVDRAVELIRTIVHDCIILWCEWVVPVSKRSRKTGKLQSTIGAINQYMVSVAHELPKLFFFKRYCKRTKKKRLGSGCGPLHVAVEMVLSPKGLKCFPDCDVCDAEDRSTGLVPPGQYSRNKLSHQVSIPEISCPTK